MRDNRVTFGPFRDADSTFGIHNKAFIHSCACYEAARRAAASGGLENSGFATSVVVLFAGLLGSHGVLGHSGQRRSRHAGCLHDLDVLAGETRHQLLARRTAGEEEVVGHAGQDRSGHRPEPVNLEAEEGRTSPSHHLFMFWCYRPRPMWSRRPSHPVVFPEASDDGWTQRTRRVHTPAGEPGLMEIKHA